MDKQIIEYRKKNKKCKWCKYYHYFSKILLNISYDECILKDKILHSNLPAKWCKYYTVREDDEKNEVSTNK